MAVQLCPRTYSSRSFASYLTILPSRVVYSIRARDLSRFTEWQEAVVSARAPSMTAP